MAVEQFSGALRFRFSMTESVHEELMEHDYLDYGMLWIAVQKTLGVKSSFFITFLVDYVKIQIFPNSFDSVKN